MKNLIRKPEGPRALSPRSTALLYLSCLTLLSSGCTTPVRERGAILLDVPFYVQQDDHCGATCLAMVLDFYGGRVDQEQLRKEVHIPLLKGTIPDLIIDTAASMGFRAKMLQKQSIADVETFMLQKKPVIAYLAAQEDDEIGHFLVITGINPQQSTVRVHSDQFGDRWMPQAEFERSWSEGGSILLLIMPHYAQP